ncbi:hypothetical protein ACFL2O_02605 [Thermodesulfobacteriota bacterium]
MPKRITSFIGKRPMKLSLQNIFLNVFIVLAVMFFSFLVFKETTAQERTNFAECGNCHEGIEKISLQHDFKCAACHVPPEIRSDPFIETHDVIHRNPSEPSVVRTYCMPCHENEIDRMESSLHGSVAGIINQTRYLWGAQKAASPGVYGLSGPFKPLPEPDPEIYPETPSLLVDDFLRRGCLRCHIHVEGQQGRGLYRAGGCAACHVLYDNDGKYKGGDKALSSSSEGYPKRHEFTKRIPNDQCLHCHNHNHIGADFIGLFEKDYSSTYRVPGPEGSSARIIYGMGYHHLSRDVHAERGMWCIDCHGKVDVMGDGHAYSFQMEVPRLTCTDCHGGFSKALPDLNKLARRGITIKDKSKGRKTDGTLKDRTFLLMKKDNGKSVEMPVFKKDSSGHSIEEHSKVRCSACHAQWSFQDYGLSVTREDNIEGYKWYKLTAQGDPELEKILVGHLKGKQGDIVSRDRISGVKRLGIWLKGWRFRRWELMPLGKDQRGMYSILRPLYQYLISYSDKQNSVVLDSTVPVRGDKSGKGWAFSPYVPHTTAPAGRSCDSCHRNIIAAGLGLSEKMTEDTRLTVPSPPALKTMRLLNNEEREKLLNPSMRWKRERLKFLRRSSGSKR